MAGPGDKEAAGFRMGPDWDRLLPWPRPSCPAPSGSGGWVRQQGRPSGSEMAAQAVQIMTIRISTERCSRVCLLWYSFLSTSDYRLLVCQRLVIFCKWFGLFKFCVVFYAIRCSWPTTVFDYFACSDTTSNANFRPSLDNSHNPDCWLIANSCSKSNNGHHVGVKPILLWTKMTSLCIDVTEYPITTPVELIPLELIKVG